MFHGKGKAPKYLHYCSIPLQDCFISNISKSMDQSGLFYVSKNDLSFWFVVVIHPKVDRDLFCGD